MKAEIITMSSALLNGKIVDKNSSFLSRELTSLGIKINKNTQVTSSADILKAVIKQAEEHADILVFTGGLGPNEDDIAKETISEHLGIPLVLDRKSEDKIITYHKNSDFNIPDNNQLQALVIQDSIPIRNATGLATGMFVQQGGKTYILLPGPFDELQPTYLKKAKPLIIENLLDQASTVTKTLRLFGLREAQLIQKLDDLVDYGGNPFIGVYEDGEEHEIQITVRAGSEDDAERKADEAKDRVLERVSDFVISEDNHSLPDEVKELLKENDLTVTAAESLTGGAFLSAFSSQLEASSIFAGGIVTYETAIKNDVLGVSKETTDKFGVVSSQCAIEMAEKSKDMFKSDIGVSLTGVAGPSSLEGEIPGTVWIGLAKDGMESFAKQYHFAYKRNKNRRLSVLTAMNLVRQLVLDEPIEDKVTMDREEHHKEPGEEFQ